MKTLSLFIIFLFCSLSKIYSQELKPDEIFEKYQDAIVVVYSFDFNGNPKAQGSGVILNDKGWIVTNFHVFEGCEKMKVIHKKDTIQYNDIIGIDIERDLLIMKIEPGTYPEIKTLTGETKVGQKVFTIGSPLGLENSMSEGIVSGNRSEVGSKKQNFIQITASISPGSSGGAVFNSSGELIGISSMGIKEGNNLNFAIPVAELLKVKIDSYSDKRKIEALNYFFQGQDLYDAGNNEEAIKYYNRFLEMFPNDAKGYNYRGLAQFTRKEYEKAIADFTKAIKLDPTFAAAYNNRAECNFKLKEYDEAVKDFNFVLKNNPDNIDAYFGRALVHMSDQDYDEALIDFKKVLKIRPESTSTLINMGLCEYHNSSYEMAIQDWKTAIKINPSLKDQLQPLIDKADILWQYNVR